MIRRAVLTDRQKVFTWRNLPELVRWSRSGKTVTWEDHKLWFDFLLDDPQQGLWIIEPDMGVVHTERQGNDILLSIYLLPEHQYKGYGAEILKEICQKVIGGTRFVAHIWSHNTASLAAFAKAGFRQVKPTIVEMELCRQAQTVIAPS